MNLDNEIHATIVSLCEQGDECVRSGNFEEGIQHYRKALTYIPEPLSDWDASYWIFVALGDAFFIHENFAEALGWFLDAYNFEDGQKNPFLIKRIGESYSKQGNIDLAKEFFLRLYLQFGRQAFLANASKYYPLISKLVD